MTFKWNRIDIDVLDNYGYDGYSEKPSDDGTFVRAEDAINREAVNAAEIATLKAQLKQSKADLSFVRAQYEDAQDYIDELEGR